jgi:predicted component of type VI protein secretion system
MKLFAKMQEETRELKRAVHGLTLEVREIQGEIRVFKNEMREFKNEMLEFKNETREAIHALIAAQNRADARLDRFIASMGRSGGNGHSR